MTVIDFKGSRFLVIDSRGAPFTWWPVNPVSMQWIQTLSPNQLIPMHMRAGWREARFGGLLGFPGWADGAEAERWTEPPLPRPVRREFVATPYFGASVTAWRNSFRAIPTPK